jgi:hypothetical protein
LMVQFSCINVFIMMQIQKLKLQKTNEYYILLAL